ncbi:MAG: dihydroxy-acid dehydratase family protein [Proteobacteria bacterium]|nr:dihydroxy-acid dehydratase family protein [Pseudomonadota bacterium]
MTNSSSSKSLRSQLWFDNASDIGMTAMYLERYFNFGLTPEELKSGRPIIGIAQSGSELSPCNFIHTQIVDRVRDGIRDGGGIPLVFPVHPIQETGRRPTAALDRNLAYLGLVEILHGYPFDGVVLTTGCDKTTPAAIMAATTVDLPAIVLSGGPMLDSYWRGQMSGSGTTHWAARKLHAKGEMDEADHIDMAIGQVPSTGHCNTMGTALTMNSLAEGLGLSLTGCASIPAPYRDRAAMAYKTGKQAVTMVHEDLRPTRILTKKAFENAIALNTVLGGSTNAQIHINAIARHAGIDIDITEWETHGYDLPLLVNLQPAGEYLGEAYHRAGGVPAVLWELDQAGKLHGDCVTCDGNSIGDRVAETSDRRVILSFDAPMKKQAGFIVMSGNLFDSAILKTSVIDEEFQKRFLEHPDHPGMFEGRVIVFEGSEDYHARINDPSLNIDETCILVIRQAGPVGWPGSAEVVNMQPPDYLLKQGVNSLPTLGDGRQSGTSGSPSILHVTPESAVGGPLALLQSNDKVRIDIPNRRVDLLVEETELEERRKSWTADMPDHQTPWQQLYREHVGPLSTGGCFDFATAYSNVRAAVPRNNH